jgi:hypothetical protein
MALPQQIPLQYTEEDAGYMSVRPVTKQTFRLHELTDMVVSVAGKDAARVQQIFRGGSVIYNGYRYWWEPIPVEPGEIEALLIPFPDDDPSRPFDTAGAVAVLLEMGGGAQRQVVEITRKDASSKKLFQKASPWDVLVNLASAHTARYEKYSHARRADLYRVSLPYDEASQLLSAMLAAAPSGLRNRSSTLRPPSMITFVCPR